MAATLFHASHFQLLCTEADADQVLQKSRQAYEIQYMYTIRGLTDAKCTWYLRILEKFIKLGPLH